MRRVRAGPAKGLAALTGEARSCSLAAVDHGRSEDWIVETPAGVIGDTKGVVLDLRGPVPRLDQRLCVLPCAPTLVVTGGHTEGLAHTTHREECVVSGGVFRDR